LIEKKYSYIYIITGKIHPTISIIAKNASLYILSFILDLGSFVLRYAYIPEKINTPTKNITHERVFTV
jgi:hypothetical protein